MSAARPAPSDSSSHGKARGPLLVTLAACIFAGANAAATAIYRRGGTITTTFLLRCMVVYIFNALLVAWRNGGRAAKNVMLLRTGQRRSSQMAAARGAIGAFLGVLLNLSLVLLTFADAFTIFKGVDTLGTIALSRVVLGRAERLQPMELCCAGLTFWGITLIAQPSTLFASAAAASGVQVSAAGLSVALAAGTASAGFNLLTRVLSRADGPHAPHLPPPMLLSFFMVVVFVAVLLLAAVGAASGLAERPEFSWMQLRWPMAVTDWLLLGLYCAGILIGQLTMAAGYATTRAGLAAFLALTELAFSYLLGVSVLSEPTNLLASLGTAVVFSSVGALACVRTRRPAAPLACADEELDRVAHRRDDERRIGH